MGKAQMNSIRVVIQKQKPKAKPVEEDTSTTMVDTNATANNYYADIMKEYRQGVGYRSFKDWRSRCSS